MSHLKFSNFAKKRKVPATIHAYIFITLCLCECVVLPVGRDVGGLCACGSCLVTRWHAQWPIHHGGKLSVCVFVCDSVQKWPSLRINHYEKPNKKGATNRGETETVKKPHAHTVTTNTHTNSLTHTDTLTLLFEFCNKC